LAETPPRSEARYWRQARRGAPRYQLRNRSNKPRRGGSAGGGEGRAGDVTLPTTSTSDTLTVAPAALARTGRAALTVPSAVPIRSPTRNGGSALTSSVTRPNGSVPLQGEPGMRFPRQRR